MPEHSVQSIHRPEGERALETEQEVPHQRSDHRIGRVLSHRLDNRPGYLRSVEFAGVPSGKVAKGGSGGHQVARLQQ